MEEYEGYSLRQFVKYYYEKESKNIHEYSLTTPEEQISIDTRAIRNYCNKIGLKEFFEEYNKKHKKLFLNWDGWCIFFNLVLWFYKHAPKKDKNMLSLPPYQQSVQVRNVFFVLQFTLSEAIKADNIDSEYFLNKFYDSDFYMRNETAIIYENFINNLQKFSYMMSSKNKELSTSQKRDLLKQFETNTDKLFNDLQGISEGESMKKYEEAVLREKIMDFYGAEVKIQLKQ